MLYRENPHLTFIDMIIYGKCFHMHGGMIDFCTSFVSECLSLRLHSESSLKLTTKREILNKYMII